MPFALVLAALIAWPHLLRPFHPPAPRPAASAAHRRFTVAGWTLDERKDAFSQTVVCDLRRRGASYDRGAVILRLGDGVDASAALYRIDGAAPASVAADRAAIAMLGLALWRDDLTNPSGGLVAVPEAKLAHAREVQVQPRPFARVRNFEIAGLDEALQTARADGCFAGQTAH